MSDSDSTVTLRRSSLSTPGTELDMIEKAANSDADEVIVDLEDSVAPGDKPSARANVVAGLRANEWEETLRSFRMNGVATRWFYDDVIEIVGGAGEHLDTVVVPDVHAPGDVHAVDRLLAQVERNNDLPPGGIGLQVQIESAAGLTNVAEIATASERLEGLVFGPGDYVASVGAAGSLVGSGGGYPGHYWHYPLSRIAHAAKAAGIQAIDGPYADLEDESGLREACRNASLVGCDGKWVIHPAQIEPTNEEFTPPPEEIERAERIVEAYAEAAAAGRGSAHLDGEMIDEATNKMAKNVLARADAADQRG